MNSTGLTSSHENLRSVVAVGRAAMLMEPMADDFNDLLMAAPVRRVMLVAEAFNKAREMNDTLNTLIESRGVMASLLNEGRCRGNGEIVVPRAFLPDLNRAVARETQNV